MRPSGQDGNGGRTSGQQNSNFGWMLLPPDGRNYCKCRGAMPGSLGRPLNKLRADIPHALKAIGELTMLGEASYVRCACGIRQAAGRARRPGRVAGAAFVAGVAATIGFGTSRATAVPESSAFSADGPVAGTIFVANAGLILRSTGGTDPAPSPRTAPVRLATQVQKLSSQRAFTVPVASPLTPRATCG